MRKRILISDIAKNLGVSVTTVSFILNGKRNDKNIMFLKRYGTVAKGKKNCI